MLFSGENMSNPSSSEERSSSTSRSSRSSYCLCRCCWIFGMSLTFTGFLVSFSGGLYFMLQERTEYYYCLFASIVCLAVFGHLVSTDFPSLRRRRPDSAVSLEVATTENFRTLLRRSQSEGVAINIPGRAQSTISLPAYLVIPTEPREPEVSSSASTESTLSAESCQERLDEEAAGSATPPVASEQPVAAGPSKQPTDLKRAAKVLAQIVNETLGTKSSTEVTAEISSESSAEAQSGLKGVRQRKPSPMEPQKYVPLPEGDKTA